MILTHSFVVGGKGYKTGQKQDGKTWQLQSFKAYPFEEYVSVSLPEFVKVGMTVTVSGTVKKKVDGEFTNFNLQYPTIDTVYRPDTQENNSVDPDPYDSSPIDIQDRDLPF